MSCVCIEGKRIFEVGITCVKTACNDNYLTQQDIWLHKEDLKYFFVVALTHCSIFWLFPFFSLNNIFFIAFIILYDTENKYFCRILWAHISLRLSCSIKNCSRLFLFPLRYRIFTTASAKHQFNWNLVIFLNMGKFKIFY